MPYQTGLKRFTVRKMIKAVGLILRLVWWLLCLILLLMSLPIRLTVGLTWRQITARSAVYVRRDWNDRGVGRVSWSNLRAARWDIVSGGTRVANSLPLVYGYVWCDKVQGKIGHRCAHGPSPHNIKGCVLREDNSGRIWRRLLSLVGPDRRFSK